MDGCDEGPSGVAAGCKDSGTSVGVAPTPGLVFGLDGLVNGGFSGVDDDGLSPPGLLEDIVGDGGLSPPGLLEDIVGEGGGLPSTSSEPPDGDDTVDGVGLGVDKEGLDGCDTGEGAGLAEGGTGTCLGGSPSVDACGVGGDVKD